MAVRSILHLACQRSWRVGSIDVTGAFLQAPRRKSSCVTVTAEEKLELLSGRVREQRATDEVLWL